ncbi:helix-turn-helix domain-containing protein [Inquilinus limosus]|uniref:helix-turn-helix domain-containing protein n=1 Tax=Inquilinus limosus TaxID=171674 RepID=UPI001378013B|nr:helix-turn-helix domain-containing protein [Inquilinus limosus]
MNIPKEPAERRVWIVGQLRLRGSSLRKIADRLGVSHQSCSIALMAPSERIEIAIAEELGISVQALFPDRFTPEGRRLPQSRPWNRSTGRDAAERQLRRLA